MSRQHQSDQAVHEFKQFVRNHRASQAHTTQLFRSEPLQRRPVEVDGTEVLEEFLKSRPELAEFRPAIQEILQPMYSLDYEKWQSRRGD